MKDKISPGLVVSLVLVFILAQVVAQNYPQAAAWFYDGDEISLRFLFIIPLSFPLVLLALVIDALWDEVKNRKGKNL
jgi:hypothetical protein